jgi:hypothetical protein
MLATSGALGLLMALAVSACSGSVEAPDDNNQAMKAGGGGSGESVKDEPKPSGKGDPGQPDKGDPGQPDKGDPGQPDKGGCGQPDKDAGQDNSGCFSDALLGKGCLSAGDLKIKADGICQANKMDLTELALGEQCSIDGFAQAKFTCCPTSTAPEPPPKPPAK